MKSHYIKVSSFLLISLFCFFSCTTTHPSSTSSAKEDNAKIRSAKENLIDSFYEGTMAGGQVMSVSFTSGNTCTVNTYNAFYGKYSVDTSSKLITVDGTGEYEGFQMYFSYSEDYEALSINDGASSVVLKKKSGS